MAGEWIKMRPTLLTSPKVNTIARVLEDSPAVSAKLTTGHIGSMAEVVQRNVMRSVTVTALLQIWGAANEHTRDGIFRNTDLDDISDIAGIPGFGDAMALVGWAIYDQSEMTVTLPNFNEYNTCGVERAKEKNRERQARYREKLRDGGGGNNAKSNGNRNVTDNVISNAREEKRREENIYKGKSKFSPPTVEEVAAYCRERSNGIDPQNFIDHYEANGWMRGKNKIKDWKACVRTWEKRRGDRSLADIQGEGWD